jgi:hypothetical protein
VTNVSIRTSKVKVQGCLEAKDNTKYQLTITWLLPIDSILVDLHSTPVQ